MIKTKIVETFEMGKVQSEGNCLDKNSLRGFGTRPTLGLCYIM